MDGAQLQGVQLQEGPLLGANLEGASLRHAFVWRADTGEANWEGARVANLETGRTYRCFNGNKPPVCGWTLSKFDELTRLITEQVPEGEFRDAALKRIELTLDPNKDIEREDKIAQEWINREASSVGRDSYEKSLAARWYKLGCAADESPYLLRGLLRGMVDPNVTQVNKSIQDFISLGAVSAQLNELSPFGPDSAEVPKLAAAFLDAEHCPGARGLRDDEIARLKEIAAKAPPPAPKL